MYTTKNYKTNNGNKTVIGGELAIEIDAVVTVDGTPVDFTTPLEIAAQHYTKTEEDALLANKLTATVAATQTASTASTIPEMVIDFNALLVKLKAAGIIANA